MLPKISERTCKMQINNNFKDKGITLNLLFSEKYKNNSLTFNFELPMDDQTISRAHVLSSILTRGCKKYSTITELGRRLNMLYDPAVSISAFKTPTALIFKVSVSYIDEKYLPKCDRENAFADITELLYDIIIDAFPSDNALTEKYTESEKKRRLDIIRAEKDNKDSYAIAKCQQIMFKGYPLGCNGKGTEEEVTSITPETLKQTLDNILRTAPVYIVYAGREREKDICALNRLVEKMFAFRKAEDIVSQEMQKPSYENVPSEVTEQTDATQCREVLGFTIGDFLNEPCKAELFNEIFGASPISRLFMNVRERLQLCYYCTSGILNKALAMFVRCGISKENKEKAVTEIMSQLKMLAEPDNITDFEFEAAKRTLKDFYLSLRDDLFSYAEWIFLRHIEGVSENVDDYLAAIDSYTKKDISDVAKSVELKLDFFLEGKAEAE